MKNDANEEFSSRSATWRMSSTQFPTLHLLDAPLWVNALRHQRNLYVAEKCIQWATIPSLTIRVYLHSFSRYCLRNMRNVTKFEENLTLQQFKVIQGDRSWCQWKAHV